MSYSVLDKAIPFFYLNLALTFKVRNVIKVKKMRDKGGYWYKNETLIERLDITEEEQRHLKTIIGTRVKYDRKNIKRNKARRNENRLTDKQQELQDIRTKIIELKDKGLSLRAIAKDLNITLGKVQRELKK